MRRTPLALLAAGLACAQPAPDAGMPAAPDSAAVAAGVQATIDRYEAADLAGDVATAAGLYTEDATVAFYGAPTTAGRANIAAMLNQMTAIARITETDIGIDGLNPISNERATAGGRVVEVTDSAGYLRRGFYRWAGAFQKGADSTWRITYLIGFPDSVVAVSTP